MKQKFKGEILTTTKTVNKIIKIFKQSNLDGLNWYPEANEYAQSLSKKFNIQLIKVCGIIAGLSPLKSWEENKRIAESFLSTGKSFHTKAMTQKCIDILNSNGTIEEISEILKGNKITSFFLNIYDQSYNGVTIDRHAICLAVGKILNDDALQLSLNQYNFFVNCYRIAAKKLGVQPHQVQAVTWVEWRKFKKELK
jgi:hypothetical protein